MHYWLAAQIVHLNGLQLIQNATVMLLTRKSRLSWLPIIARIQLKTYLQSFKSGVILLIHCYTYLNVCRCVQYSEQSEAASDI